MRVTGGAHAVYQRDYGGGYWLAKHPAFPNWYITADTEREAIRIFNAEIREWNREHA